MGRRKWTQVVNVQDMHYATWFSNYTTLNVKIRQQKNILLLVINVHDSHYATPSASCIHGSHAVDATARLGRAISWCPSHTINSTLQWSYGIEIWCPVYDHATQWGLECSVVKTTCCRVSTDRGLLTRYMHGGAFDDTFKALCTSWFAFMAALTQQC